MYECPASIALEPNNYISSRSVFFFWLAEQRIHSSPASPHPAGVFSVKSSDSSRRHKSHSTWFSMFLRPQWLLYLFTAALRSVSPASAPHCVSIQPRSGRQTTPLPFQTAAGRQPKQKALAANEKAENLRTVEKTNHNTRKAGSTLSYKCN